VNRPKFCVGEQVKLVSESSPQCNREKTEVTGVKYENGTYKGWAYETPEAILIDTSIWCPSFREKCLRKIPPDERLSFDEMMSKLNKKKVLEDA